MSSRPNDLEDAAYAAALGRAIKVLRTDLGLSRSELSEAAEISYPYLSEIENGKKRPSDRTLHAIARALGIRTHELVEMAELRAERTSLPLRADADESVTLAMMTEPSGDRVMSSELSFSAASDRPRWLSGAIRELDRLLSEMGAEDVERILDLARRLAR